MPLNSFSLLPSLEETPCHTLTISHCLSGPRPPVSQLINTSLLLCQIQVNNFLQKGRQETLAAVLMLPPHITTDTDMHLALFIHVWDAITFDVWVLNIITYGILHSSTHRLYPMHPSISYPPRGNPHTSGKRSHLKGTSPLQLHWFLLCFAVAKRDGGLCPILDLHTLDMFITPPASPRGLAHIHRPSQLSYLSSPTALSLPKLLQTYNF